MTWDLVDHASDATQRRHLLFEIDFGTPVYWTDCQIPIAWGGHMWDPKPTSTSGITSRQMDGAGATINVGNASNFLSALFFYGEADGALVSVRLACFDLSSNSQSPAQAPMIYQGKIDTLSISNTGGAVTAVITLGPFVEQSTKMLPTRKMTDLLRHDP